MYLKQKLRKVFKNLILRTPLKNYVFFYKYEHYFNPAQLCFITRCINEIKDIPGSIVEIGCAVGRTTVFLNKYMDSVGIEKKYICIDTFSGFTEEDISFEVYNRNKDHKFLSSFKGNDVKWFYHTLKLNKITRVKVIKSDIKEYNFNPNEKISLCIIDVDIYQPIKVALKMVYDLLQPGGIILVDDCVQQYLYDGAYQAYQEYAGEKGIKPEIILNKIGIIRKPLLNNN